MPAGFHMIPISMGIYQVIYPELGDYQFKCNANDNDNLVGTGTTMVSVIQGTSLYILSITYVAYMYIAISIINSISCSLVQTCSSMVRTHV